MALIKNSKFWRSKRFFEIYRSYNFLTFLKIIFKYAFKLNKLDLDRKKYCKSDRLDDLFSYFGSDKAKNYLKKVKVVRGKISKEIMGERHNPMGEGHNYAPFYEKLFSVKKNKNLKILELGVLYGNSTASFHHYFPKSEIYCIDLNERAFKYKSKRIKYFEIDLRNKNKILNFTKKYNKYFDIIIDDASHSKLCIMENLNNFFQTLKDKSFYIIEDYKFPELFEEKNDLKNEITISDLLDNIKDKKIFSSKIIQDHVIEKIMKKDSSVQIYAGQRSHSHTSCITFI